MEHMEIDRRQLKRQAREDMGRARPSFWIVALVYVLLMAAAVAAGLASGLGSMEFYPQTDMAEGGAAGVLVYAAYALLCFMPAMMQIKEVITWRYLRSRI